METKESTPDLKSIQSLPMEDVQHAVDALFAYLRDVLYSPKTASLKSEELAEPFRDLADGLLFIGQCINESRTLANDLARGNLEAPKIRPENDIASGLKNLHSTLRHITWQAGQVAKGDYSQHLSFTGALSEAINEMIEQLKERDEALRSEVLLNQQKAAEARSTVLLLEGITKNIAECIVVVDREDYEWLYTNHDILHCLIDCSTIKNLREALSLKVDEYNEHPVAEHLEAPAPMQSLVELRGEDDLYCQSFSVAGYPITWMDRKSLAFILVDITNEQKEREQLEQAAYYDTLTNVYSRHYGMKTLERWVDEKQAFVIAFIDMDGLKYINDTFGHAAGDEYILATAEALSSFSEQAILSRLGGDEFMLLVRFVSAGVTCSRLEEIRKELAENFDGPYERSFSFGVVEAEKDDDRSASFLLSIADESMYEDKRNRKKERRASS